MEKNGRVLRLDFPIEQSFLRNEFLIIKTQDEVLVYDQDLLLKLKLSQTERINQVDVFDGKVIILEESGFLIIEPLGDSQPQHDAIAMVKEVQ